MKQRTRNIRLLILVGVLLVITVSLGLMGRQGSDSIDLDRDKFIIENTIDITRISSEHEGRTTEVTFSGGRWMINNEYEADPARVHLLFAAIQQAKIRRPVSREEFPALADSMQNHGYILTFGDGSKQIGRIETLGNEAEGITWFRDQEGQIFLMEIPGYRAYIHGIIAVEGDSWRNHNLFHRLKWNNLKTIKVEFPISGRSSLEIARGDDHLEVMGLVRTDTTRLFDYIDYISLLNAEQYLNKSEAPDEIHVQVKVDVRDIGNRPYIMEILEERSNDGDRIGRMDSSIYFTLPEERIPALLVGPEYFSKREAN